MQVCKPANCYIMTFASKLSYITGDLKSLIDWSKMEALGLLLLPRLLIIGALRMSTMLVNPAMSRTMGIRGRKQVKNHYSIDSIAGKLESLYQNINSKNRISLEKEQIPSQSH